MSRNLGELIASIDYNKMPIDRFFRASTIYTATYGVMEQEHEYVWKFTSSLGWESVQKYLFNLAWWVIKANPDKEYIYLKGLLAEEVNCLGDHLTDEVASENEKHDDEHELESSKMSVEIKKTLSESYRLNKMILVTNPEHID